MKIVGLAAVVGAAIAGRGLWRLPSSGSSEREQVEAAPGSTGSFRSAVPLAVAELLYDGKLAKGWQDWGWGRHELGRAGPARIVFASYGGPKYA
jgi:hypothetical protein